MPPTHHTAHPRRRLRRRRHPHPRSPLARRSLGLGVGALLVLAGLLAACGDTDDGPGEEQNTSSDSAPVVDESTSTTGEDEAPLEDVTDLSDAAITLTTVAELESPLAMATRADGDELYVAEREGRVRILRPDGDGFTVEDQPVIDISGDVVTESELGLLGLAFSEDGSGLYLSYSNSDADHRLVEYTMDGDVAEPDSRRELIAYDDQYGNHNGGQVTLGPDGLLYWSLGDGGGAGDPLSSGQDPTDLFGSLLRIDPEGGGGDAAYGIPSDNPFADGADGRPEVYLYGVRNPWRFSFDSATGDLWIGDVGQDQYEEVDWLPADEGAGLGANLGWSEVEGDEPFDGGEVSEAFVEPIYVYSHDEGGCSVTGGYVSRGEALRGLYGAYVFGDYCAGEVRALVQRDGELLDEATLAPVPGGSLVSFGEGPDGTLYALSNSGQISRIDPA